MSNVKTKKKKNLLEFTPIYTNPPVPPNDFRVQRQVYIFYNFDTDVQN